MGDARFAVGMHAHPQVWRARDAMPRVVEVGVVEQRPTSIPTRRRSGVIDFFALPAVRVAIRHTARPAPGFVSAPSDRLVVGRAARPVATRGCDTPA